MNQFQWCSHRPAILPPPGGMAPDRYSTLHTACFYAEAVH
jgi:hypothetical protein